MTFVKGKSGNPGGRPKLPEDIKEARKLNQIELERLINKFLSYSKSQLQEHINHPDTPSLELMICSIIAKGAIHGDPVRMEYILSRILGKMKDRVEHSGHVETSEVKIQKLSKKDIESVRSLVKKALHEK